MCISYHLYQFKKKNTYPSVAFENKEIVTGQQGDSKSVQDFITGKITAFDDLILICQ